MAEAFSRVGQFFKDMTEGKGAGWFRSVPRVAEGEYSLFEVGAPYTTSYRAYLVGHEGLISPFHDVPLYANESHKEFNMIVEIPRWSNAKIEICTSERLNPLRQDVKSGKVRFVHNVYPYHGYIWNYGAFPQTWEDPEHVDKHTNAKGDNDPLDVCEIGSRVHPRGAVVRVKALGVLGLIDEGESDWKIIAIDVTDPMASKLNNIEDVERLCPGLLPDTLRWFKLYKIPAGKGPNRFAFDGQYRKAEFAHELIEQTHGFWKRLQEQPSGDSLTFHDTAVASRTATNANRLTDKQANDAAHVGTMEGELMAPAPLPDDVNKSYFIENDAIKNN